MPAIEVLEIKKCFGMVCMMDNVASLKFQI